MARRRFRSGGFAQKPRKTLAWSSSAPVTGLVALAASTSALIETIIPNVPDLTELRVRGLFGWRTDQLAASEIQVGAVGMIVVEEPAATLGITALPVPNTDGDSDWMWHSYYASRFEFGSAIGFQTSSLNTMIIDSKAMRKVSSTQRVVVVIENSGLGIQFFWSIRILAMVP